jgi:hypothetical protein
MPAPNKIDSNLSTFAFAEEISLQVLPGSPIWYGMDVNSYSDFGSDVTKISREPINGTRQRLKGSVSYISANAGFNIDLTRSSISRLMQGFMFNNAIENTTTASLNAAQILLTAVASGTGVYSAVAGLGSFVANQLVNCTGFTNAANNGIFKVISATATTLTLANPASVAEVPTTSSVIEAVGFEFAAGALALTVSAASMVLTATAGGSNLQSLKVGSWVFIGGDLGVNQFSLDNCGFARVLSTTATSATFDKTTFTPTANVGAAKNVRVYFSNFYANATTSSGIITKSYQLERQVGNDGTGIQSQYVNGAVANEFNIAFKNKDKISADLTFVGLNSEERDGIQGIKAGTRTTIATNEACYNSSLDVYRAALAPSIVGVLNSPKSVGFVTDLKFSIKNNVTALEAIGEVTGFDVNIGSFDVMGDLEAYFTTFQAVKAIKANTSMTLDLIISSPNEDGFSYHGKVIDIPLIEIDGGKLNVVKDQSVKMPIATKGLRGSAGYTCSWSEFKALPMLAAPL